LGKWGGVWGESSQLIESKKRKKRRKGGGGASQPSIKSTERCIRKEKGGRGGTSTPGHKAATHGGEKHSEKKREGYGLSGKGKETKTTKEIGFKTITFLANDGENLQSLKLPLVCE